MHATRHIREQAACHPTLSQRSCETELHDGDMAKAGDTLTPRLTMNTTPCLRQGDFVVVRAASNAAEQGEANVQKRSWNGDRRGDQQ